LLAAAGAAGAAAESIASELLPIIDKEPALRQGSYSNAMEEVSNSSSK
jgi:hypothetical protein